MRHCPKRVEWHHKVRGKLPMPADLYRFQEFELDRSAHELRRGTESVRLERIPFELLTLLVERRGQLVAREEIIERIWGKGVFHDTEHGINTAVRKIRQALHDDPGAPRFVVTVPAKGYRFVAPVETAPVEGSRPGTTLRRPWILVAAALLGIALLLLRLVPGRMWTHLLPWRARPAITSLAVLPLENLSGDPAQDYFSDGLTDELITEIARISTLRVISRSSSMQYKASHKPLPVIAKELGVDAVVEGTVVRSGDQVRIV